MTDIVGHTSRVAEAPRPAADTLLTLASAARRRRRVRLRYRSWRGEETDRELDPYGLVFHSGRWYVTGLDRLRRQIRTFRLDRVASAETLAEGFPGPEEFDPVAHVMDSLSSVPYRHEVRVLLETTQAEAQRRLPPSVARLSETEGRRAHGGPRGAPGRHGGDARRARVAVHRPRAGRPTGGGHGPGGAAGRVRCPRPGPDIPKPWRAAKWR
ncbi:WYL domain-containing protein [Sphaerisporangium sp. NPDC088356]|uniref:helix-turn-helix transcriptional regulator n=1 Tax=Sphaerisporangium sp. NPDC088356 TaxID=3154871 RepID=UPI0034203DA9